MLSFVGRPEPAALTAHSTLPLAGDLRFHTKTNTVFDYYCSLLYILKSQVLHSLFLSSISRSLLWGGARQRTAQATGLEPAEEHHDPVGTVGCAG